MSQGHIRYMTKREARKTPHEFAIPADPYKSALICVYCGLRRDAAIHEAVEHATSSAGLRRDQRPGTAAPQQTAPPRTRPALPAFSPAAFNPCADASPSPSRRNAPGPSPRSTRPGASLRRKARS